MIVDQAEEDVEMAQDPFLEAGISIPKIKKEISITSGPEDSGQDGSNKTDVRINVSPPVIENPKSSPD